MLEWRVKRSGGGRVRGQVGSGLIMSMADKCA